MSAYRNLVYGNLAFAPEASPEPVHAPNLHVAAPARVRACAQVMPADKHAALYAKPQSKAHAFACGLIAALICLAVFCGGAAVSSARSARYDALVASLSSTQVTVCTGDSLWTIATEYQVDGLDTSQTVELIKTWNGLSNATLQPGTKLVVPVQE